MKTKADSGAVTPLTHKEISELIGSNQESVPLTGTKEDRILQLKKLREELTMYKEEDFDFF